MQSIRRKVKTGIIAVRQGELWLLLLLRSPVTSQKTAEAVAARGGSATSCIVSAKGHLTASFLPRSRSFTPLCTATAATKLGSGPECPLCAFTRDGLGRSMGICRYSCFFFFLRSGAGRGFSEVWTTWVHSDEGLQNFKGWNEARPAVLCAVSFTGRQWSDRDKTVAG